MNRQEFLTNTRNAHPQLNIESLSIALLAIYERGHISQGDIQSIYRGLERLYTKKVK